MFSRFSLFALFCSVAAFAQPAKDPAFEIASVKVVESGMGGGPNVGPASLTMQGMTLARCIAYAYDVQAFQISGVSATQDVLLTINAKAAGPVKESELKLMLRTLLAERLKLKVHHEKKEMNTYVLSIAKNGHKLKEVEAAGSPSFSTGKLTLTGKGSTLAQLTQFLSKELREPVVDQTGLTGLYDYFLDINPYMTEEIRKSGVDGPPAEGASIIATAMQGQLGLKMESKKAPVEMIVVDSVERVPIEN